MRTNTDRNKFLESIVLSVIAMGIYNCVLQFVLYPFINRNIGDEAFGDMLTLLSVLSVTAMSVGVGANYSRLACKPRFETENGDFNRFLLKGAVSVAVISAVSLFFFDNVRPFSFLLFPLLGIFVMLRYYAEVDFRLQVNYRKNFVFYMIIAAGSIVGAGLFKLTGYWETAIISCEIPAVLYVGITGRVLKKPYFKKSERFRDVGKSCVALTGSQLFSNLTLNADRLLISAFSTGEEVTVYYTATLLGKAMALLTGPVSGVLIGFLAKTEKFGRRQFLLCSALAVFVGVLVLLLFIPLSPIIIGFLYPEVAKEAGRYFVVANGAQIVYFISNLLLVTVLRFAKEKVQLYINIAYSVAFFAVCTLSLMFFNLYVFCLAILILNIVRMTAVIITGIHYSASSKEITK